MLTFYTETEVSWTTKLAFLCHTPALFDRWSEILAAVCSTCLPYICNCVFWPHVSCPCEKVRKPCVFSCKTCFHSGYARLLIMGKIFGLLMFSHPAFKNLKVLPVFVRLTLHLKIKFPQFYSASLSTVLQQRYVIEITNGSICLFGIEIVYLPVFLC